MRHRAPVRAVNTSALIAIINMAPGHVARHYGVHKFHRLTGLKDQLAEAGHLHTQGVDIKMRTGRVLHPTVGIQYPQRREI